MRTNKGFALGPTSTHYSKHTMVSAPLKKALCNEPIAPPSSADSETYTITNNVDDMKSHP